jgi:CheY-like chemotaxis protein
MASPLLEQNRHRLVTAVPPTGLVVAADPPRLAQAVSNLLINAANYTAPGGTVEVCARREDAGITVTVRDDGAGIEAALLPRVFDLFVQAPQCSARSQGGLGLGLANVRSLVERHGGTVAAHSNGPGQGSAFSLWLPASPEPAPRPLPGSPRQPGPIAPPADAPRVLVVDDNEDAAHVLADALCAAGYRAAVAHDGPAALRLATTLRPDLAVLDIGLPVMDGHELGRRLRALLATAPPKLVAVTGYGLAIHREQSRAAGFDAHLVKPIQLAELLTHLRDLLRAPKPPATT